MTSNVYSRTSTYSRFNLDEFLSDIQVFVKNYKTRLFLQLNREQLNRPTAFISFNDSRLTRPPEETAWLKDNHERFFKDTPNKIYQKHYFLSELGYIMCMAYSPDGEFIVLGHSSGLIQLRHGHSGSVLATLRNVQFPPKPVYAIEYSRNEERICYAACVDGTIYRIEIPFIDISSHNAAEMCIRSDPALEWLNTQFFGSAGASMNSTPFISQRIPPISFSITADSTKMVVGYGDTSIKIYDMQTQEVDTILKVHKLRLQFIPKKLQRLHCEEICSVRCHNEKPNVYATAAWDKTLRIWDTRCSVGCMMTFEGVNVIHDSIDLNNRANHWLSQFHPVVTENKMANIFLGLTQKSVGKIEHFRLRMVDGAECSGVCIGIRKYDRYTKVEKELVLRDQAISGSWQTTEALSVWDLVARKRLNVIRVQNRRPNVDGEYFYACRYWRSSLYNRKGKYAIVGGSGTGCVEVINTHNRYITCSYPAAGTVTAITSYEDRIAFGGTAPVFNLVSFHDPKHEKYKDAFEAYDFSEHPVTLFERGLTSPRSSEYAPEFEGDRLGDEDHKTKAHMTDVSIVPLKKSRISTVPPRGQRAPHPVSRDEEDD